MEAMEQAMTPEQKANVKRLCEQIVASKAEAEKREARMSHCLEVIRARADFANWNALSSLMHHASYEAAFVAHCPICGGGPENIKFCCPGHEPLGMKEAHDMHKRMSDARTEADVDRMLATGKKVYHFDDGTVEETDLSPEALRSMAKNWHKESKIGASYRRE